MSRSLGLKSPRRGRTGDNAVALLQLQELLRLKEPGRKSILSGSSSHDVRLYGEEHRRAETPEPNHEVRSPAFKEGINNILGRPQKEQLQCALPVNSFHGHTVTAKGNL